MSIAEEKVPCEIVGWERVHELARAVCREVRRSEFQPDVVVAIARDGWIAGRYVCDFLGMEDLASLDVDHSQGVAEKTGDPSVRYSVPADAVDARDVLVVDEIASTGGTLARAVDHVSESDPRSVRTATLQCRESSSFEPDFVGETVDRRTWMVYPWNRFEVLSELVRGVMTRTEDAAFTETELVKLLEEHHDVDWDRVAHLEDLGEVLAEMERRGSVESAGRRWETTS